MGVNSNGTTMMDQGVFENLGSVTWDTTAKTAGFTAVSGNGYFVNTTSGAITVTLPATPSAGDVVGIKDYANTADTNAITLGRNGSNINGEAVDYQITIEGLSAVLVYVDATKGWLITNASQASDIQQDLKFVTATGGTILTSGDYKTHVFTGPGTFTVTCAGNAAGSDTVEYLVVAGGAGGGRDIGGGGGAGGFRSYTALPSASPLNGPAALPVSVTGYPITVGGGGVGTVSGCNTNGSNSVFSTITSAGGGAGGGSPSPMPNDGDGAPGGSGGGVRFSNTYSTYGGAGNTPPVAPPQGQRGGGVSGGGTYQIGGGGGATQQGEDQASPAPGPTQGGDGGDGSHVPTTFIGPTAPSYGETGPLGRYFSGGGGGGGYPSTAGVGGLGGGGGPSNENGATNTGGGGTGGNQFSPIDGNAGGSGIVMIRYKYQ